MRLDSYIYIGNTLGLVQVSDVELAVAGEDERSITKNIVAIQAECKKTNPDRRLLADKIKRTASYRQKLCLEKTTDIVLDQFPCLRQHIFVS